MNEEPSPIKGEKNQPYSHMGITDLKAKLLLNKTEPEKYDMFWCELEHEVLSGDHLNLVLEIDVSYPIPDIIKALRKLIAEQKAQVKKIPDVFGHFIHFIKLDFQTWIDYFRCYDLRQCKARVYGQIARTVYGDSKKRDLAEKAYDRVEKLIWYAETHNWPPPKNFQNKKFPPSPPQ